jgi:hypothetical protein
MQGVGRARVPFLQHSSVLPASHSARPRKARHSPAQKSLRWGSSLLAGVAIGVQEETDVDGGERQPLLWVSNAHGYTNKVFLPRCHDVNAILFFSFLLFSCSTRDPIQSLTHARQVFYNMGNTHSPLVLYFVFETWSP